MTPKRKPTKPRTKVVKGWGGFSEGRLDWNFIADGYAVEASGPAIYRTRTQARARYQDVRRVLISIAPSKGKRK